MKNILLNNLGSKRHLIMKFGQFIYYYKRKRFIKNFYEKYGLEISFRPPFNFQRILYKKKSEEVYMLIWTNFDSFAMTCLTMDFH